MPLRRPFVSCQIQIQIQYKYQCKYKYKYKRQVSSMLCHRAGSLYLVREAISLARLGSDHRSFEFVLFFGISLVYLVKNAWHKILWFRIFCVFMWWAHFVFHHRTLDSWQFALIFHNLTAERYQTLELTLLPMIIFIHISCSFVFLSCHHSRSQLGFRPQMIWIWGIAWTPTVISKLIHN